MRQLATSNSCLPLLLLIVVITILTNNLATAADKSTTTADQTLFELARANDDFGLNLLEKFETEERSNRATAADAKNIFISAFSVGSALAMTMAGAAGETASEIKKTLGFNSNLTETQLFSAYSALFQQLSTPSPESTLKLEIANGLALQKDFPLLPAYLNVVNNTFKAKVFPVDFKTKAREATAEINRWASEKTRGKIPKIFDNLDPSTRLILLNALYFKGAWTEEFVKSKTQEKEFTVVPGQAITKVNVSMMAKYERRLRYAQSEEGELVELPYKGQTMSMLLFLPNEGRLKNVSSISALFRSAHFSLNDDDGDEDSPSNNNTTTSTRFNLQAAYSELRSRLLNLFLPRFKVECSFDMKPTLRELGIRAVFDDQTADFSRMNDGGGGGGLAVDDLRHKTFVAVNEEGAEAAAVTSVRRPTFSARNAPPMTVAFNRPFLFAIRENAKQLTLFTGIINKPQYQE